MPANTIQIIRLPDVIAMTGMSRASIYNMVKRGDFPQHVKIGPKASGWVVAEVQEWIAAKVRARSAAQN